MDAVADIKDRLDVVDVVGEYLPLKPAGSGSFKANCPFHQEKTPSFYVNRGRQSWHCFGCNIGGDLISFVERMEGMEFIEALELLAQKAGVPLPKLDRKDAGEKKRLQDANGFAAKLFRQLLLTDPEAAVARTYVAKRGIDDLTADLWVIGYAPQDWTRAEKILYHEGYVADDLVRAGLAAPREHGTGIYFRFRGRLMFPISDTFGHIIGFTGRILTDEKVAKYVNTPETALYKKSHVLYGLDKAKAAIKCENLAVIVEGNMDALTSHQFGVHHVVASSGTALTLEQLSLLKRFSSNLAIAFDTDAAGIAATLRGLDLARQMDFSIRVIQYDPTLAKDPDELIRKDVSAWKDAVENAIPIMDWIYRQAFSAFDPHTPDGKKRIAQFVLTECRHIADPVERDAWISRLAKDLDVAPDALRSVLSNLEKATRYAARTARLTGKAMMHNIPSTGPTAKTGDRRPMPSATDAAEELEAHWLALALDDPKRFRPLDIPWSKPAHQRLYTELSVRYHPDIASPSPSDGPDADVAALKDYLTLLVDHAYPEASADARQRAFDQADERLRHLRCEQQRTALEQEMREAERLGDPARINDILLRITRLNAS